MGAKAISIYRDGSKRTQPLNTSKAGVADTRNVGGVESGFSRIKEGEIREVVKEVVKIVETPKRRKLPDERHSITHKFDIAGHEGYITVGLFEDGSPGEIFLTMAKEGSTISGFADAFAQAISYALQYGVPLQVLVDKFSHARFEPSGMTKNPEIRFAKSIVDYIFRWLATKFLSQEAQFHVGVNVKESPPSADTPAPATAGKPATDVASGFSRIEPVAEKKTEAAPRAKSSEFAAMRNQEDAPPCTTCGSIMIRSGSCYKCANCGTTSGCA
jgi:ribonucleoside-diphosphate reductase alpha chain